eukprot:3937305-Rhodomonas_salina.3
MASAGVDVAENAQRECEARGHSRGGPPPSSLGPTTAWASAQGLAQVPTRFRARVLATAGGFARRSCFDEGCVRCAMLTCGCALQPRAYRKAYCARDRLGLPGTTPLRVP